MNPHAGGTPITPAEKATIVSEAGEAVEGGLRALAPADKSWIAGFIVVVAIIVISDAWVATKTLVHSASSDNATRSYFELLENNRANELRRAQETIKALADAVARDSERAGMAAVSAIDESVRKQFIGPPEAPR